MCRDAVHNNVIRLDIQLPVPIDVLHIDDVLSAFLLAIEAPFAGFHAFNISSGIPCDLLILAREIAELTGSGCTLEVNASTALKTIAMDNTLARAMLNFDPAPRKHRLAKMLESIRAERT
jgi:nucleoside-diphosphate-sugar epimerase